MILFSTTDYVIMGLVALVSILLLILLAIFLVKRSKKRANVINGVRYSVESTEKATVNHHEGDLILECGTTYTVEKGGYVIPGIYTILASNEANMTFNIRIGGFVREYKHNQEIVLKEGEQLCPVSNSIILR